MAAKREARKRNNHLNTLSKKSRDFKGNKNEANSWRQHFSIMLQRCNIRVSVRHLSCGKSSENNQFHRDIFLAVH